MQSSAVIGKRKADVESVEKAVGDFPTKMENQDGVRAYMREKTKCYIYPDFSIIYTCNKNDTMSVIITLTPGWFSVFTHVVRVIFNVYTPRLYLKLKAISVRLACFTTPAANFTLSMMLHPN